MPEIDPRDCANGYADSCDEWKLAAPNLLARIERLRAALQGIYASNIRDGDIIAQRVARQAHAALAEDDREAGQ